MSKEPQTTASPVIPAGESLESWMNAKIARYETRTLDWNALKF